MDPADNRRGLVRNDHQETARHAAEAVRPRSGTQRLLVLGFIEASGEGGCTRECIADGLGLPDNSVRPRVKELLDDHWIGPSGRTGLSRAGSPSELLVAAKFVPAPAAATEPEVDSQDRLFPSPRLPGEALTGG